jgi:p-hydroxybenzoate 3-monooxygenase
MTSMLHTAPDATEFDVRRQVAELETVTGSRTGATLLAENYVGLPMR